MSITSPNRLRIREVISLLPGVHLRQVERLLNIPFNSIRHHVGVLSGAGEILLEQDGGHLRLYPHGISEDEKVVYAFLRSSATYKILRALVDEKRLTNQQISMRTQLAKSTVSEAVHHLLQAGLVRTTFSFEGRKSFELRNSKQVSHLLDQTKQSLLQVASTRFVDLWDF